MAALVAAEVVPPWCSARSPGWSSTDSAVSLAFALRDRFISRLLLVHGLASLATGATSAMLVVLAYRRLGLPPAGFAWLIGAIGFGALLGPLIPKTLARDYRGARWLFVPNVIRGAGDVLLSVCTPLPIALGILVRRQMLLVLDNCEHVVEACVQLAEAVLRGCPQCAFSPPAANGLASAERVFR